jgi:hypothetical protein
MGAAISRALRRAALVYKSRALVISLTGRRDCGTALAVYKTRKMRDFIACEARSGLKRALT